MPRVKDLAGRQYTVSAEEKREHELVKAAYKAKEKADAAKASFDVLKAQILIIAKEKAKTNPGVIRVGSPAFPVAVVSFPQTVSVDSEKVSKLDRSGKKPFDKAITYKRKKDFEDITNGLDKKTQGFVKMCLKSKGSSPKVKFETESGTPKDKKKK